MGLTTDHYPLIIDLPQTNKKAKIQTISYRKLKEIDFQNLKDDLVEAYRSLDLTTNSGFYDQYTQYDTISRQVIEKHAPIMTRRVKEGEPEWIDQEYRKNRALRRRYERKWRKKKLRRA